jgi:Asp-tRNA(Asn)/Glu-tRNA(Gln) amidotransferase A subunit family amidase
MSELADLTAIEARNRMIRGEFSAVALAEACLARIAEREPAVEAWAHVDPEAVLAQARAVDAYRASGRPAGPLHGVPVGLKDIVDTADMPTENGTIIDQGRRPNRDATIVQRLRSAGAVIMGKTVTTELGSYHPGKTRNPHHPEHTPGGSSSGSAAAVAAGMVPLATGTQTHGSVIRPASFCGVVGFKPSFGLIPRSGILKQASPLDTVGVFAGSVADTALLVDALAGNDPGDPDSSTAPPPRLLDTAMTDPPVTPALAFVKTPAWQRAEPETREAFAELVDALKHACQEVTLPEPFSEAAEAQKKLMLAGIARNYDRYYERGRDRLSAGMQTMIEEGRGVSAVDYLAALDWRNALHAGLEPLFDRYDAIVTPAAPGEAPHGLDSTGDPAFNGLWTFCGVPALTLPLMQGPRGLPLGVQVVGRRGEDGRLLRTARWLTGFVEQT